MATQTAIPGSHVLITGGASGLGLIMARRCLEIGAKVTIWDLFPESIDKAVTELRQKTGVNEDRIAGMAVDVSTPSNVNVAAKQAGQVDILINSAGVVTGKELLDASDAEVQRTFAVNTLALYWTTRAFLPGMLKRNRGCIVVLSSAAGLVGVARQTDYSASKFAAVGFTESLRQELNKRNSSVNTLLVCPYYIDTGMFEGVVSKFPRLLPILQPEHVSEKIIAGIQRGRQQIVLPPLVRLLAPARILPVAVFDKIITLLGVNDTMNQFKGR